MFEKSFSLVKIKSIKQFFSEFAANSDKKIPAVRIKWRCIQGCTQRMKLQGGSKTIEVEWFENYSFG